MLETLWYLIILLLQVLQVNPQLPAEKFQIDVFVASKPAYSFAVKGNAVQGQVVDTESRNIFGEFESTRRLPQAYVVFPRTALPPEIEAAAEKSKGDSKDSSGKTVAATSGNAATDKAAEAKPKDLYPFTIDFTKALKQLASFCDKPRQTIEYPEKDRFLSSGDQTADGKDTTVAKASPTPSATVSPSPAAGAVTGDTAEEEKAMIEIRQYSNRLVLTADFIQTVIIVNFMP